MIDFYDLIDTYATLRNMDKSEVLHLWYRGVVTADELLAAQVEDEGIYGDTDHLIRVIKTLVAQTKKDHNKYPWEED